ncbi:MAG: hypothetical protein QW158_07605 [Nitrososphaerales archaeon]
MGFVRSLLALFLALLVSGVSTSAVLILPPPTPQDPLAPKILSSKGQSLDPVFSPDGRFIAYSSNVSGDFDIWLVDVNGRHQAKLTSMLGDERKPQFSPDGKKVAFIHSSKAGEDIWVVNRNGSNPVKVTNSHTLINVFEWSPQSGLIVYDAFSNGIWNIWITDVSGGLTKRIGLVGNCYDPSWSHDGSSIVFVRETEQVYSLDVVDVFAASFRQMFSTTQKIRFPKFSNDDKRIFFLQSVYGSWSIFVTTPQLGDTRDLLEAPPGGLTALSWKPLVTEDCLFRQRPKGNEIIFTGYSIEGVADLFLVIENATIALSAGAFKILASGTSVDRLTEEGYSKIFGLVWSPEGDKISFAAVNDSMPSIIVVKQYSKTAQFSLYGR